MSVARPQPYSDGFEIVRLDTTFHSREGFSCGIEVLDAYLRTQAGQAQKKNFSATDVLLEEATRGLEKRPVVGYVTLLCSELVCKDAGDALLQLTNTNKHSLPAILIGRLAIDQRYRRKGLGEKLLGHALRQAVTASELAGCYAVVVDAKTEEAVRFYKKYGFIQFSAPVPRRLFIPIATVRSAKG